MNDCFEDSQYTSEEKNMRSLPWAPARAGGGSLVRRVLGSLVRRGLGSLVRRALGERNMQNLYIVWLHMSSAVTSPPLHFE